MLPSDYFDTAHCPFAEIFDEARPVWEALKKIRAWLKKQKLGQIEGEVSSSAFLVNPEEIYIGKGAVVEPGAYLKGPLWIGEGATIRHGAYLRGDLIAGDKVVIGHDTEVKQAIFLTGAHAAHFAYVGDSILGRDVNLGAGVKLANLRLNGQEISVAGISTGLRKFGAVIGDGTQVGCNAVLNPGTLVGRGSDIFPLVNVSGLIPARSRVTSHLSVEIRPKK